MSPTASPLHLLSLRSRSAVRLLFMAMVLLVCTVPGILYAQSNALSVEVEQTSNVSRTTGPISLALRFDWRGSGVFDGQLRVNLHDSENLLVGSFLLDDLFLSEGVTRQEIMLPGLNVYSMNDEVELRMRLLDRDGREIGRLPSARLRVPGQSRRSLVIAVCRPEYAAGERVADLTDGLRLESLFPEYVTNLDVPVQGNPIVTRTVSLTSADAPADPLRFCSYDIVMVTDDALSQLSQPQLQAMLAWTRAGGAVCLLIDGRALSQPQLDFVNGLIGSETDVPEFLLDSSGQLVYGAGEDVIGPLTAFSGLGRSVIVGLDGESADSAASHWPETAAFLWRLRQAHVASVASEGVWNIDATIEAVREYPRSQNQYGYGWQSGYSGEGGTEDMLRMQALDMDPIPIGGGTGLLTRLMPGDIRVVPLWLIGLVLTCYVGVIGPLDYFVLGRLRLRRFTWISFPVMTLVFTLSSVVVSEMFLRVADERQTLLIRDLDAEGVVTRENRLELLFPSGSRTMRTELGRGLFCALRYQDFSQMGYYYGPFGRQPWEEGRAGPAQYIGRMPARSIVEQRIGKWTPQLNRSLTIPLTDAPDAFTPLSAPRLKDFIRDRSHGAIIQHLRSSTDGLVGIYLFNQDQTHTLQGPQSLFESDYEQWNQVLINNEWVSRRIDFLQQLSVRQQPGFFGVVSQISPTGGYRFEDLSLLDATNHRQWLLVVAVEEDNQLVLYRKLYVLDD